ncbi:UNVERIFIED_CONTAM: hypothetical protein FKN15_016613 [Acipenser sinensis]
MYGQYTEQLGNFAKKEAAHLLTEGEWRKQRTAEKRVPNDSRITTESKKQQPYSKCRDISSQTVLRQIVTIKRAANNTTGKGLLSTDSCTCTNLSV